MAVWLFLFPLPLALQALYPTVIQPVWLAGCEILHCLVNQCHTYHTVNNVNMLMDMILALSFSLLFSMHELNDFRSFQAISSLESSKSVF